MVLQIISLKNVFHTKLKKKKVDQVLGSYPYLAGRVAKYGDFWVFLLLSTVICSSFKPSTRLNL